MSKPICSSFFDLSEQVIALHRNSTWMVHFLFFPPTENPFTDNRERKHWQKGGKYSTLRAHE